MQDEPTEIDIEEIGRGCLEAPVIAVLFFLVIFLAHFVK